VLSSTCSFFIKLEDLKKIKSVIENTIPELYMKINERDKEALKLIVGGYRDAI